MSTYPDRHHPVFFLADALNAAGANAEFARDARTENCWGAIVNGKTVVWLIDNRHAHEAATEDPAAKRLQDAGALVMCAQKPDAERVGAKWLPLAVSPNYRLSEKSPIKLHQAGMVAYIRDAGRMQVVTQVARHFRLCVEQGTFGDEALSVYWQSEVGLNVSMNWPSPTSYDLNMRFWEILSTGTPLVTNDLPEMRELGIEPGVHCMTYRNADEVISAIQCLIDNPSKAKEIGTVAAKEVSQKHTYGNRAKVVLEWLRD